MYKGIKYRIYPNREQQAKLNQFFGCTRFIYNKCLEWYIDAYEQYKKNNADIGNVPLLTHFKKEFTFLKQCDNAALAYARSNFERALKDFFKSKKGKRKGKCLGFPQFKAKNKSKCTYRTCDAHGTIHFDENNTHIRLPKIGFVRCKKHRDFDGIIKAVTVERKSSGKYYISVMVEVNNQPQLQLNKIRNKDYLNVVGLDMSMSSFVISSHEEDNTITKYTRNYRKEERNLRRLQRRFSRKQLLETDEKVYSKRYKKEVTKKISSNNREKARKRLARLHEKISNRRKDYIEKLSLYYALHYDVVILEDINLQDMSRSLRLGKSVMDLGFGMFRRRLSEKGVKYDCSVLYVDKWYPSSKTCSACGNKNSQLMLSDREWVCPVCGVLHDRDFNAACNLERSFSKVLYTAGTAGINACGDNTTTLRAYVEQVLSLNQEAPSFRWA